MRTSLSRLLAATTTALLLSGCGGGGSAPDDTNGIDTAPSAADSTSQTPVESYAAAGRVIEIGITGDEFTPNGDRVEVGLGEPITLDITADRAGELHVHSTPEQELEFDEGETQVELTFDKPGVVEVEDHESGNVILQLEVS